MGIRHPKTRAVQGQVMDPDGFLYEALQPFVEEMTGGLNEQNFATGLVSTATRGTKVIQGAAFHLAATGQDSTDTTNPSNTPANNIVQIAQTREWQEVIGRDVIMGRAGSIWLLGACAVNSDRWITVPTLVADQAGTMFALAVDGTVIPESGPGSYEEANESFSRSLLNPEYNGSIGILRFMHPVRCSITIPAPAGTMRVSLMARSVGADLAHPIRVFTRQIVAVLMPGAMLL